MLFLESYILFVEGRDQFHERIVHRDIETESELVEWRDWDCDDAIEWDKYNQVLKGLYRIKTESKNVMIHFLNENKDYFRLCNVDNNSDQNACNQEIIVIIEGFLIYHQFAFTCLFDYGFFLDASFDICKQRRRQLSTIVTKEGVWDDPPGYYELVVWPRYLKMKDWILESKTIKNTIHILTIDKNITISILLNNCLAFISSNLCKV